MALTLAALERADLRNAPKLRLYGQEILDVLAEIEAASTLVAVHLHSRAKWPQSIVLHWDGQSWRLLRSPRRDTGLRDIVALANHEAWVLEGACLVHWRNGVPQVTDLIRASGAGLALALTSPKSGLIADSVPGDFRSGWSHPIVIQWNDTKSFVQSTPLSELRNADLLSLSPLSSADVWGAGTHLVARYAC